MSSSSSSRSSLESSITPSTKRRTGSSASGGSDDNDNDTSDTSSADEDAPRPLPPSERAVLSHAERRRQRKKETQARKRRAVAAPSGSPHKKRKLDDGTADVSPPEAESTTKARTRTRTEGKASATAPTAVDDPRRQKRQNSVWVGNLAFRTTRDALQGFFDGVGTITRIHMPMRRGKETQDENMGFAYVDFDTPDAKVIAITLSEGQLDGRNLLIKDGHDFTGRPAKLKMDTSDVGGRGGGDGEGEKSVKKASTAEGTGLSKTAQKVLRVQKQPPAPSLFLGNLGFETTEGSIRELFEAHRYRGCKGQGKDAEARKVMDKDEGGGEGGTTESKDVWIRKIRMGTFEDSGTCKGFAFVDFTSIEHATTALINPRNHRLNGRDLVVEYASPDAVRRGGRGPRNAQGDQGQKNKKGSTITKQNSSASVSYAKQHKPRRIEQNDGGDNVVGATTRSRRPDQAGHDRPHTRRAKPGAALAHAQRQSAAILPSQGQKTVF